MIVCFGEVGVRERGEKEYGSKLIFRYGFLLARKVHCRDS